MACFGRAPPQREDGGTGLGELIVQWRNASRASQLHQGGSRVKARRLLTQTLFAAFLFAFAALSLLLTCYHVARPSLSGRTGGRALAARLPDSDDDEERSFIIETCLELHETLGYVYDQATPLPEKREAVSAIESAIRTEAQNFAPQPSSSTSVDVGISAQSLPRTSDHLYLDSVISHASASQGLATLQPPTQTPSSGKHSPDESSHRFLPPEPPHSNLASFNWSVGFLPEFSGGSSAYPSQPPEQPPSPGFISQFPALADFGLSSEDWGPVVEAASATPHPPSSSPTTRPVTFREEDKKSALDVAGWGTGQLQLMETQRGTGPQQQEEADQPRTGATGTELLWKSQTDLPSPLLESYSEPLDLSFPQSSEPGPSQPSPARHALSHATSVSSPDSSELSPYPPSMESVESASLRAEKRSALMFPQSPLANSSLGRVRSQTPLAAGVEERRTEQAESGGDEPSRKRFKALWLEGFREILEEQDGRPGGPRSPEDEGLPFTNPQHSAGDLKSSVSPKTRTSSVAITLKSNVVIHISHPPPSMPPNTHPYYRLPNVPLDAIKPRFYAGAALLPGTVNNIIGHLLTFREIFMKDELNEHDVHVLMHTAQYLLKYLLVWHRRPLENDRPQEALVRIGMRYLCFEGLLSAVQILGPAMHPQDWFPLIVEGVPTTYQRVKISGSHKAVRNLVHRFSQALEELKRGIRPSLSETLFLKRILFKWPKAPSAFKKNKWDPWRADDDEENQGGSSGAS
ncbi:hypothetical protein Emag_003391 [Eimeria magna]